MNRFKQKIKDYDEAMQTVDPAIVSLAFIHKERFLNRVADFAVESNEIENIQNDIQHKKAGKRLIKLLELDSLTVADLCTFNKGHGSLRTQSGMNVFIGNHEPKPGGMHIMYELDACLGRANQGDDPYTVHNEFETLHPFLDGNGRTGRAIWLWQMVNQELYTIQYKFLRMWYYQSLDRNQKR